MASQQSAVRSVDPSRPTDVIAEQPEDSAGDVYQRINQARVAQQTWWGMGPAGRSLMLQDFSQALSDASGALTDLIVREVGKPGIEAAGEMSRARAISAFYAQQPYAVGGDTFRPASGHLLWTERRPHGVAGLITPWNFPIAIPLWKAMPALAAGNAVVLKPSPDAIGCALELQQLAERTLPKGLFQVVVGGAESGAAVVSGADVVSFTGSEQVGRLVVRQCADQLKPSQAEMGGHSAAIVLADADLDTVAPMVASAAMAFAGQKCTATRRIIAVGEELRRRDVAEAVIAAVRAIQFGDPRAEGVLIGPVINEASLAQIQRTRDDAASIGADVTVVGELPADGYFSAPTVVQGVPLGHRVVQEETFGPLVTIQEAASIEDAVRLAESTNYGLVSSVHGNHIDDLMAVASRLDTGMIKLNAPTTGVDFHAPFGGEGNSSFGGREQGLAALDFYSTTHTMTLGAQR